MVWNDEEDVWTREMPHLRIVSDAVWYRANEAIDTRMKKKFHQRGQDHPLFGLPRDSRGPLSGSLVCGVCGAKMYRDGRNEGGYRCSKARCNNCWNKATVVADLVHKRIGQDISNYIMSCATMVEPLVEFIKQQSESDDKRQKRKEELQSQIKALLGTQERLLKLAGRRDDPPDSLLDELTRIEVDVAKTRASLQELEAVSQQKKPEITRERILELLRETSVGLLTMDREIGPILERQIPGKIRAVPFQQFGTGNVVLRAEFELQLVNLLPHDLRQCLEGVAPGAAEWLEPANRSVDLFRLPPVTANALRAIQLYEQPGSTLGKLASALGMSVRTAHLAKDLGQAMREASLADPYIRLEKPPENAAHWHLHPKFLGQNDDGQNAA